MTAALLVLLLVLPAAGVVAGVRGECARHAVEAAIAADARAAFIDDTADQALDDDAVGWR